MKRGAEKQISKDDGDDSDGEQTSIGFVKANESELSARKIRALPRRSMVGSPAPLPPISAPPSATSTPEQSTKPKFAGFSGFGSNSGSFTFTAAAPDSPSPTKSTSAFPSSIASPPAMPLFSSAIGSTQTPSNINTPGQTKDDDDYSAAFEFYKSIRGLNVSFSTFLAKTVQEDPFADLAEVFDQYNSKRRTIQNVWDKHTSSKPGKPDPAPSNNLFGAAPITAPPAKVAAMPTPPASFFNKPPAEPSSTSSAPSGGFTPTFDTKGPTKGFSFPAPASSSTGPPAPTFALGNSSIPKEPESKPSDVKSAFSFGSSTSESSSSRDSGKSTSLFGGTTNVFGTTNLFGSSASKPKDAAPSTNLFGSSEKTTSNNLFGPPNPDKPSPFGSSTFGSSSSLGSSSPDKSTTTPGSFGFGGKPFSGFGSPGGSGGSGSIGNPVGFGFGSPKKTTPPAAESSSSSSGFTFGSSAPTFSGGKSAISEPAKANPAGDDEAGEEVDHAKILSATSVHDQEGEGEEDEDTTHNVKCKVYKLAKTDGTAAWVDMGIGFLRLKKHKETDSRRLLLRNSSTGKLVINFNVHSGLKPGVNKQIVSFMGHDEKGTPVPFRLRVKTEEAAVQLKDVLEREVEFAKSKSG